MSASIRVSGTPTTEEVAAVLAVLATRQPSRPIVDAYAQWRRIRQTVVAQTIR